MEWPDRGRGNRPSSFGPKIMIRLLPGAVTAICVLPQPETLSDSICVALTDQGVRPVATARPDHAPRT
jgi:hypothetical protein